ncbi:carbon-nitrogen hydrolase [Thalassoglobus polymorphus]|uniref:N-carbamoyl-D-amino acid hydrolase n=1 Tax=Thalassoglobus polymorphus TaxID=2527994 RepID=A0A517QM22_9PLAN|nr:carbon-nitrogen hydrolase [Thalassoglobus polymorphus]QDT32688.1 N-carbamoyl-D-amino acid hydrolase [Thalassoglobus polymorphus]
MPIQSRNVNVALIQRAATLDPTENLQATIADIEQAAKQGAQIVCTQELFRSQYFCQSEDHAKFDLAEKIPGPSTEAFSQLAKKLGIVIVASLFEKRAAGLYHNTAVVLDADGAYLGMYRKMHIPDDPLFYEKFYFTPGDLGFKIFETKFGNVGVLICWDQWYPEAARLTALAGAEILFYPTAIGWHPTEKAEYGTAQHDSWETIQRSHAIANGVYVASANRIGHEGDLDGGIEFWGQSFICNPSGTILNKASVDQPEILMAECDFAMLNEQRTHWPFLRDRRIDAYSDITKRYRD